MAANIDKSLYQAPEGIEALAAAEPEIEIEIEDPESVTIGVILAVVFAGSVFSLLYALLFITQPMAQAPNDAAFIDLVSTLSVFLTGTLAGMVSANGLKSKPKPPVEDGKEEPK